MTDRWWEEGACASPEFKALASTAGALNPTQVFYPVTQTDDGRSSKDAISIAKYKGRQERFTQLKRRTCGDCPVRQFCLLDACQNDGEAAMGFVGGLEPKQRVDLVEGADLVSTQCPGCETTLWGTTKSPPPKRCSKLCKGTK